MNNTALSGVRFDKVTLRLGKQDFAFDLRLPQGIITAVTGPSGSGKSTLLNLIAGFDTPNSGRILIHDQDVTELAPADRPVSVIFQDNNLFSHLDVFTNIALGIDPSLKLSKDQRQSVSGALERVGLAGFEARSPITLSGGERQRVAMARALVRHRSVLLLDEPFAALDPGLRAGMAELLSSLQRENDNTVLLVTHQPEEVQLLAKHVVFLDKGNILFEGSPEIFAENGNIPQIRRFLRG
ncbi:ATP-binding cassette domain-containing protein [Agrobacterium sp.]|uniref:thiamine ABC transporter ATP-binding protein n=1 Tax=Agrobacterium sp. TaxID=361 RepID=UPI0028B0EEE1|nr:ATP-binding cassette domain-containing protein [Agrobacterium sp.]